MPFQEEGCKVTMDLDTPFGMLLFLSIFEALGGGAIGIALRGIVRRDYSGCFFLIWGAGFGGIPLIIGAASFSAMEAPTYFLAQLFVFFGAMALTALMPTDFMPARGEDSTNQTLALVGAVMAMVGGAIVLLTLRNGVVITLLAGGIVAMVGVVLLGTATVVVWRTI